MRPSFGKCDAVLADVLAGPPPDAVTPRVDHSLVGGGGGGTEATGTHLNREDSMCTLPPVRFVPTWVAAV